MKLVPNRAFLQTAGEPARLSAATPSAAATAATAAIATVEATVMLRILLGIAEIKPIYFVDIEATIDVTIGPIGLSGT